MKRHNSIFYILACFFLFQCFDATENINSINLFNESTQLINEANEQIRTQNYIRAIELYKQAIDIDSSKSDAYYGLLTAIRLEKDFIRTFRVITEGTLLSIIDSFRIILDSSISVANEFYQGSIEIRNNLAPFILRDSLTDLYQKSLTFQQDSLITLDQLDFITNYLIAADTNEELYQLRTTTLTDRFRDRFNIGSDITIINYLYYFLNYQDTNDDLVIDSTDQLNLISEFNTILSLSLVNTAKSSNENILEEIINNLRNLFNTQDPSVQKLFYAIFYKLSQTENITALLQENQLSSIQPLLDSVFDHLNYFLFQDNRDNDGDGCIDEEAYDLFDNDGDGLVDEDTRLNDYFVTPLDLSAFFAVGSPLLNIPVHFTGFKPDFITPGFFVSVVDSKNSGNKLKFRDSILSLTQNSMPPYNLTTDQINYAKTNIGGCWNLFY